jgi:hypothetical protein
MDNPENEEIIIPVCTLLIAAGIQQYRGNRFGRLWVRPWIARRNQYGEKSQFIAVQRTSGLVKVSTVYDHHARPTLLCTSSA